MKNYTEAEALPHKKPGKNQAKSSPNKHGCEKNDYQPHEFASFDSVFYYQGEYRKGANLFYCIDCGKRAPRNKKLKFSDPIATVAYFGRGQGYWEVEVNKRNTHLRKVSKMDW